MGTEGLKIYTIGHSNRSLEEFLGLLREFEIGAVADVRRFPSSRKFPHFNRENLDASLDRVDIEYRWLERLGGRIHGTPSGQSPNTGLHSAGFRSYADHMMTNAFAEAADGLVEMTRGRRTVLMCAERFFWKCHRRLLSDYLVARGHRVKHILGPEELCSHALTDEAEVREDGTVVYK